MDDRTRAFADINGLRLYYEIHGSGRPVVLLHGGLLTIDFMFGPLLPTLAARRQVVAVELQGHGRTPRRLTRPPTKGPTWARWLSPNTSRSTV